MISRIPILGAILLVAGQLGQSGAVFAAPPVPPSPPTPRTSTDVLFIGNSLTFYNSLPAMVEFFFRSQRLPTVFDMHAVGAALLADHADNPAVAQKIASRRWTYVVLQDQSQMPAIQPDATVKDGKRLCDMATKAGAMPVFYLTWGYKAGKQGGMDTKMQLGLDRGYGQAAAGGALIVPVGPAWQAALARNPKLPLYVEDGIHPSPEGSYLAACVFYAVLAQRSPVGLPNLIAVRQPNNQQAVLANVPAERARFYQQIAADTVKTYSLEKAEAEAAKRDATLPSVNDVRTKLKKTMTLGEVEKALGAKADQKNPVDKVVIFNLQNDTQLWLTFSKDGSTITKCWTASENGKGEEIQLP
jgi:hypothetical protein